MTEVLSFFYIFALAMAAIAATIFPIVYSFSTWDKWIQGRALMTSSITVAVALDATLLFVLWPYGHNTNYILAIGIVVFLGIAVSKLILTAVMMHTNYFHAKNLQKIIKEEKNDRNSSSSAS